MIVAVTGAEGLIGSQVAKVFSFVKGMEVHSFGHRDLDITEYNGIRQSLGKIGVQLLINCAGTTDVVLAQSRPDISNLTDSQGTKLLASYCKARGIKMLQLSPSIVFNEPNLEGYSEDCKDPYYLNQQSVLARNKAMAELEVLNTLPDSDGIIVRSSKVFGFKGGKSYVNNTLLARSLSDSVYYAQDDIGNPTFSKYLAWSIVHLVMKWEEKVNTSNDRVFHAVPKEICSDFKQAKFAGLLLGIGDKILAGTRSKNSPTNPIAVLKNTKLFRLTSWEEGTRELTSIS